MSSGFNAESYVSLKMCQSSVDFKEGYGYLNIIDQSTFQSLKNKPDIVKYDFLIKPYGNREPVKTIGEFSTLCRYKNNKSCEKFVITIGSHGNLLSYQTSVNLGIIKNLARTMSIINRPVYSTGLIKSADNVDKSNRSLSTESTVLSEENSVEINKCQTNVEVLDETYYKKSNHSTSLLDKGYITGIKDNRARLINHYISDIENKYHKRYLQKKVHQRSQKETSIRESSDAKKEMGLSQIEQQILRSRNHPVEITEKITETITINGETGQWLNKEESTKWKGDVPLNEYTINRCSRPLVVHKKLKETVEYTQQLAVRYLKPTTPDPPGDIVITVNRAKASSPAPPIILRQAPPRQPSPPPIIIREAPPKMPRAKRVAITISGKKLPPPPRKVVLERLPALPSKPPPVIIERWLKPENQPKRNIVFIKAEQDPVVQKPRNIIIQWLPPQVKIRTKITYLGVQRADPIEYMKKYSGQY